MQISIRLGKMAVLGFEYHDASLVSALRDRSLRREHGLQVRLLLLLLLLRVQLLLERGYLLLEASDLRRFLLKLLLKAECVLVVL